MFSRQHNPFKALIIAAALFAITFAVTWDYLGADANSHDAIGFTFIYALFFWGMVVVPVVLLVFTNPPDLAEEDDGFITLTDGSRVPRVEPLEDD